MKKILLAIFTLVMSGCALTQMTDNSATGNFIEPRDLIVSKYPSVDSRPKYFNDIHINAVRNFKKRYKEEPTDEQWRKVKEGYIVNYTLRGIKHKAAFDINGDLKYTIRYYKENGLSSEIRAIVKRTYYDYSISQVEELEIQNDITYLVHLEDKTSWKIVRVCEGEMDVWKAFSK